MKCLNLIKPHVCSSHLNVMLLVPFNIYTPTAIADIYFTLWRKKNIFSTYCTYYHHKWTIVIPQTKHSRTFDRHFFFHFEKKTNSCAMWTRLLHSRTKIHFYVLDVIKINVGKEISKCTAVSISYMYKKTTALPLKITLVVFEASYFTSGVQSYFRRAILL